MRTLDHLVHHTRDSASRGYYCGGEAGGVPADIEAASMVLGRSVMTFMAQVVKTKRIKDSETHLSQCRMSMLTDTEPRVWC